MKTKAFYFISLLGFWQPLANAQNSSEYNHQLDEDEFLKEKIYVYTDRSFYLTGETLWFKFYLTHEENDQPIDLSKIAYVEILDEQGKPAIQKIYSAKNGLGNGSIYLSNTLKTGNYLFRAYTSWMKNFGTTFFYEKQISIVNPFIATSTTEPLVSSVSINFYPEGGAFVDNLPTKATFQVCDNKGRPLIGKGFIVSRQDQDTLANLKTDLYGLGSFQLTPDINQSYNCVFIIGDSTYLFDNLLKINPKGYSMHVQKLDSQKIKVTILTNFEGDKVVYLANQLQRDSSVWVSKKLKKGKAVFEMNTDKFKDGINSLILYDNEEAFVAKTYYIKKPKDSYEVAVSLDEKIYKKRDEVNIILSTKEISDANLCISVTRIDSTLKNNTKETDRLTTDSKLKDYYLNYADQDFFNLTNFEGFDFRFLPELEGHLIDVQLMSTKSDIKDVTSYLSVIGKTISFYASKSNNMGITTFITRNLYGEKKIIMQTDAISSEVFDFKIVSPFIGFDSTIYLPPLTLKKTMENSIRHRSIEMQVQNAYNGEKNMADSISRDTISFYGLPDKNYVLDNYRRFPTLEEVMREYVPEVRVRKKDASFIIKVFNQTTNDFFDQNPLILLDGIPIINVNQFMSYNPLKISKLEVITDRYVAGPNIWWDGILSYHTYKGNAEGWEISKNQTVMNYNGIELNKVFYSPSYTHNKSDERRPDFRSLLYWNPEIEITKNEPVSLKFFTSDIAGIYKISIRGLSSDGEFVNKSATFEVGQ